MARKRYDEGGTVDGGTVDGGTVDTDSGRWGGSGGATGDGSTDTAATSGTTATDKAKEAYKADKPKKKRGGGGGGYSDDASPIKMPSAQPSPITMSPMTAGIPSMPSMSPNYARGGPVLPRSGGAHSKFRRV
jgi:hypothetical protein